MLKPNRDPNNYCRTKTFAYEQQMRQMMDVLVTIPDSQIAIIHPIRVSQLCNFKEEKVIDEWWLTRRCGDLWEMSGLLPPIFEQDGVCPSLTELLRLTASPTPTRPGSLSRHQQ